MRDSRYVGEIAGLIFVLIADSTAQMVAERTSQDIHEFRFFSKKVVL